MTRARDMANLGSQAGSGLDASDITTGTLGNTVQDNITRLGTVTTGTMNNTIGSSATFPAGHIIQVKAAANFDTNISGGYTDGGLNDFEGVSQTDITLDRTANTSVIYWLQGGGVYKSSSGASLFVLGRRTSGPTYSGGSGSGHSGTNLGHATYGHCRVYGGTDLLLPFSVMAFDHANINGNYTYRFFYRFTVDDQNFSWGDRGEVSCMIMEYISS